MKHANASIVTAQSVAILLACFIMPRQNSSAQTLVQPAESIIVGAPTVTTPEGSRLWERAQVQVGLPVAFPTSADQLIIQPKVQVAAEAMDPMDPAWLSSHRPSADLSGNEQLSGLPEVVPTPPIFSSRPEQLPAIGQQTILEQSVTPFFESIVASAPAPSLNRQYFCSGEGGLGRERLAFSLFDIDPAQPFNNFRVRTSVANRLRLPDRAEYFWAKAGSPKGPPQGESVMDYQEARLRMELGSQKFSTAFEVPFRSTNPELNANHAGLGDLQLITKTVLLDGDQWMLTQYFGTFFPTGHAKAGLGTGHFALEPGMLFRNEFSSDTWMHGELKFWFPLGADPQHGGQILKFATGFNHVWMETDRSAWIPSFEMSAFSVLNGLATNAVGELKAIDQDTIFYLTPGVHYAVDKGGDFGLFEVGTSLALAASPERFTDSTWNIEVRWSW